MDPRQYEILRELVTAACVDMLAGQGHAVRVIDLAATLPARLPNIVGFIGFAGSVRGSLMISGPSKLFRSTHPSGGGTESLSKMDLFDWVGELANQLLGSVKRRFCERGRDFEVSTPTAIEGRELKRRLPGRAGVLDLVLAVGGDLMTLCFEITPPGTDKLFPDIADPIVVSQEGELVLF